MDHTSRFIRIPKMVPESSKTGSDVSLIESIGCSEVVVLHFLGRQACIKDNEVAI